MLEGRSPLVATIRCPNAKVTHRRNDDLVLFEWGICADSAFHASSCQSAGRHEDSAEGEEDRNDGAQR